MKLLDRIVFTVAPHHGNHGHHHLHLHHHGQVGRLLHHPGLVGHLLHHHGQAGHHLHHHGQVGHPPHHPGLADLHPRLGVHGRILQTMVVNMTIRRLVTAHCLSL